MALTTQQQILVEQRLTNDKKSTPVAYLLWFFLGGLGAHRFYLGKSGSGFGMLALLVLGWLTIMVYVGVALLVALGVWLIVDAFLIPGLVEKSTSDARIQITREVEAMKASD